jgi:sulfotransferase famil protein
MAVHFIHVSKSGGTALRYAIRAARVSTGGPLVTPWGELWGHDHRFLFSDVGRDDKAVFALRDPVSRFLSSFYSRFRKGEPRYYVEWTDAEREAFGWFSTPQALADALAEPSGEIRERAEIAMQSIRHLRRHMTHWTGKPAYLRKHIDKVLYVARQETLDEDWEKLKELLDLPRAQMLPHDAINAHRTRYAGGTEISEKGLQALRAWYADDYELLEIGEEIRTGAVRARPSGLKRLVSLPFASGLTTVRHPER